MHPRQSCTRFAAKVVLFVFLANFWALPPVEAQEFRLPAPGQMVSLSPAFSPAVLKGIKLDPKNPLKFHFFVDKGENPTKDLKDESAKLIKYFLASLTIPEKDLWVNLSPYENNRIVPKEFGQTEMGRDLLAQDYLLKQITASLIYPESQLGKEFWQKVYAQAQAKYGTTNIPVNTFNKVWIVPEKAVVYENGGTAFVLENHLKVMLEEDYVALNKNINSAESPKGITTERNTHTLGSQIIRELVLPALETEVNQGKNFSQLRQVFYSLILATWYKKKIKDSILAKVYTNKSKIAGLSPTRGHDFSRVPKRVAKQKSNEGESNPEGNLDVEAIYQQYLKAFKKGVYNYIKEESDPISGQNVPRKYFSGGVGAFKISEVYRTIGKSQIDRSQLSELKADRMMDAEVDLQLDQDLPAQSLVGKAIASLLNLNGQVIVNTKNQQSFKATVEWVSKEGLFLENRTKVGKIQGDKVIKLALKEMDTGQEVATVTMVPISDKIIRLARGYVSPSHRKEGLFAILIKTISKFSGIDLEVEAYVGNLETLTAIIKSTEVQVNLAAQDMAKQEAIKGAVAKVERILKEHGSIEYDLKLDGQSAPPSEKMLSYEDAEIIREAIKDAIDHGVRISQQVLENTLITRDLYQGGFDDFVLQVGQTDRLDFDGKFTYVRFVCVRKADRAFTVKTSKEIQLSDSLSDGAMDAQGHLFDNPLMRNFFDRYPRFLYCVKKFLTRNHPLKIETFNVVDRKYPMDENILNEIDRVLKLPRSPQEKKGLHLYKYVSLRELFLRTTSGSEDLVQSLTGIEMYATYEDVERIKDGINPIIEHFYLLFKAIEILSRDTTHPLFQKEDLDPKQGLLAYLVSKSTYPHAFNLLSFSDVLIEKLMGDNPRKKRKAVTVESLQNALARPDKKVERESIENFLALLDKFQASDWPKTKKAKAADWKVEINREPDSDEIGLIRCKANIKLLKQALKKIDEEKGSQLSVASAFGKKDMAMDGYATSAERFKHLVQNEHVNSIAVVWDKKVRVPWGRSILKLGNFIASLLLKWPGIGEIYVISPYPEIVENMDPRIKALTPAQTSQFPQGKKMDALIDFGYNSPSAVTINNDNTVETMISHWDNILNVFGDTDRPAGENVRVHLKEFGLPAPSLGKPLLDIGRWHRKPHVILVNSLAATNTDVLSLDRDVASERWAALIKGLLAKGHHVVLNGGEADDLLHKDIFSDIANKVGEHANFQVRTFPSTKEFVDFMAQDVKAVVTQDTGTFHAAWELLHLPTVVLTGKESHEWIPPEKPLLKHVPKFEFMQNSLIAIAPLEQVLKDEMMSSHLPALAPGKKDVAMDAQESEQNLKVESWKPVEFLPGILVNSKGQIKFANQEPMVRLKFNFWAERHGETTAVKEGRLQGNVDTSEFNQLTAEGRHKANEVADKLVLEPDIHSSKSPVVVITSELQRAKDTAQPFIENLNGRYEQVFEDIRRGANEISFGLAENKNEDDLSGESAEILTKYRQGLNAIVKFPDGKKPAESFIDLLIRVKAWLEKLNELYPGRTVVLFGHGTFLSAVKILLGDQTMYDTQKGYIDWRKKGNMLEPTQAVNLSALVQKLFNKKWPDINEDRKVKLRQVKYMKHDLDNFLYGIGTAKFILKARMEKDVKGLMSEFLEWLNRWSEIEKNNGLFRAEDINEYKEYFRKVNVEIVSLEQSLLSLESIDVSLKKMEEFIFLKACLTLTLKYLGDISKDQYNPNEINRSSEDLNKIIEANVFTYKRFTIYPQYRNLHVISNYGSGLNAVPVDFLKFHRVILNLLGNAKDAVEGRDVQEIVVKSERDGRWAMITVSDNGSGISPENLSKVFDSGFSTKAAGKGSGLGLFICKQIVEAHGGTISVESQIGKGTIFTVRLPVSAAEAVDPSALASQKAGDVMMDGQLPVSERKGGINLNPAQMKLETKLGTDANSWAQTGLDAELKSVSFDAALITGASFKIISITPVINLLQILELN